MSSDSIIVPHTDFVISGHSVNPKQIQFIEAVYSEKYKYLAYGGAIRGGKSYVVLFTLHTLCMTFPGSKWVVVRATAPDLKKTTIPSFNKLIDANHFGTWRMSTPMSFTYHNGSEIMFIPESITDDPMLNSFLGLECNGFFLEQAEEISIKMWEMALQRTGSWYIPKMPKPYIFLTFNPTQEWPKQKFYEPFVKTELKGDYFYLPALPNDNPHVTKDQWDNWSNMADRYQSQFIKGDWTDYTDKNSLWAFSYDSQKHGGLPEIDTGHPVYLSFDFNRNPICCSVIQMYDEEINVLELIKLANSNIYEMCGYIKVKYPDCMFIVTGDASGKASSAMVSDNLNYYTIIANELYLQPGQIQVPSINPTLEENRVLVNSLLERFPKICIHNENAKALHFDLSNAAMRPDGTINKGDRNDERKQWDAIDTFRYFCNTFLRGWIHKR